jgi:nucleoside-diphosphate-sugar epimerase
VLFLTGASGYIGMRVGERLAGRSRRLRCLVLPDDPIDPANRFPTQVVRGDLTLPGSFDAYGEGVNAIVHAAAAMPPASAARIRAVNVEGTANMVAFAKRWRIRRFVYFSASPPTDAADDAYATSKVEAERLVAESGLDYTILRLALVYGPGGARPFRNLVSRLHRIPLVYPMAGGGRTRLRPVYIGDVVGAVELVLSTAAATRKTYDVSGATTVAMRELVDRIAAAEGLRRLRVHLPMALCRVASRALSRLLPAAVYSPDALLGLAEDADLDHTRFQEECGYAPLTLEQGFARVFGGGEAVR